MEKKYPKEIFSSIRKYKDGSTKTFSVETLFKRGNERSPLMPGKGSIVKFSIFGKDGGVNGNIHEDEIDAVYEASRACVQGFFMNGTSAPSQGGAPCSQKPFVAGRNKGKTPAQVLSETGDENALLSERDFLARNADRYPANNAIIQAIDEAISLFRSGGLSAAASSGAGKTIYKADVRPYGKEGPDGKRRCFEMQIMYIDGSFTVDIQNYKAPVDKMPDGTLRVRTAEAAGRDSRSFKCTWDEWMNMIAAVKKTADAYNMLLFRAAWKNAELMEQEAANEWRGKPQYQQPLQNQQPRVIQGNGYVPQNSYQQPVQNTYPQQGYQREQCQEASAWN